MNCEELKEKLRREVLIEEKSNMNHDIYMLKQQLVDLLSISFSEVSKLEFYFEDEFENKNAAHTTYCDYIFWRHGNIVGIKHKKHTHIHGYAGTKKSLLEQMERIDSTIKKERKVLEEENKAIRSNNRIYPSWWLTWLNRK